jgi:hypothetical protein
MSKPKVLVLGCGPAGLIAAYAAQREFGADVLILSMKRPSPLFGCQYLHAPLPGITEERDGQPVTYTLHGTAEAYRAKQYGSVTLPVSPQQLAGNHMAWDIRVAYERLWERFEPYIHDISLNPSDIVPLLSESMPDLCISSLPAPVLCQTADRHVFNSVNAWAIGDAPALGQRVADFGYQVPPFTVWCSGEPEVSWYRACNVFDHTTVEWPGHKRRPPIDGVVPFPKPLSTDCDCMPSILRVGRYGRWQKGTLSHEAYAATATRIGAMA